MSTRVKRLLIKRRGVIEGARNKEKILEALLSARPRSRISHTLVYTTDKRPSQIIAINRLLVRKLRLNARQLTAKETQKKETEQILRDFSKGTIQLLTCKRVLDEGVNIPQVTEAFILASNTVKRQWIQRRGRLLRLCPEIGKDKAILHDFVVVPPRDAGNAASAIMTQEVARATEFATLAANAGAENGPFSTINELIKA